MHTPELRRRYIVEYVIEHGETSIDELTEKLAVSAMTVYRDVAQLEQQGLVTRRKGEIRAANSSLAEASATIRKGKNLDAKSHLAAAAAEFLHPGMAICLDDSTTNLSVLEHIKEYVPVTVITNAQFIADKVKTLGDARLILTGGEYKVWADAYTGLVAETAVDTLRVDVCIMSATAVDTEFCFHPTQSFARIKQRMLATSRRKILIVDSSKFSRPALFKVGPLSDFDVVITEESMAQEFREGVIEAGCRLIVVPDPK